MVQACDERQGQIQAQRQLWDSNVSVYVCDCRISYGHVTVVEASDSMGLCRCTSEVLTVGKPMVQASDWR